MTAVIDLFNQDLGDYIDLEKVVGLKPLAIGYTKLVFHFKFKDGARRPTAPIRQYLEWWFKNKLHGDPGPFSNEGVEAQVWWVSLAVEIKEDRDRASGGHAAGYG